MSKRSGVALSSIQVPVSPTRYCKVTVPDQVPVTTMLMRRAPPTEAVPLSATIAAMDAARAVGTSTERETLSDRDREILEFERQWWKYAGAKEQAIRELFDMSATRYYQVLNVLVDRPEALADGTGRARRPI